MSSPTKRVIGAGAELYQCCQDHTSIEGLARLQRERPRDWHMLIDSQSWRDADANTTLGEYLRNGGGGLLVPKTASDTSIKKKRCGARRVADAFGHLRVAELTEADLLQLRQEYEAARPDAPRGGLLGADLRILRQAVHRAQQTLGVVRVKRTWGGSRPAKHGKAKPRQTVTPHEVRQLLQASSEVLAAAIALIVACGLLPSELLALRVSDLNVPEHLLHVRHRGVRGWNRGLARRHVRIPPWAWQFVLRAWPRLSVMPRNRLLFPSRNDPKKPWTNLGRAIRQAATRAGLQAPDASDPRWTPSGLRLLYQEIARKVGLPRALVRGTVVVGMASRRSLADAEQWLRQSDRMALGWTYLLRPPGYIEGERHHVPRRAPGGVMPGEPEWPNQRTKRWLEKRRRDAPLPSGCDDVPGNRRASRWKADLETVAIIPETSIVEARMAQAAQATKQARAEAEVIDAALAGLVAGGVVGGLVGYNLGRRDAEDAEDAEDAGE